MPKNKTRTLKPEVKEILLKNGRHLQDIADMKGVHFGTVYRWITQDADNIFDIDVIAKIVELTGILAIY